MNIRKTFKASVFSFIVLNIVGTAAFHFLLIILGYVKHPLRNKQQMSSMKIMENHGNTKSFNFQSTKLFHNLIYLLLMATQKNVSLDSWVEHSNKIKKNAKCINFQFHNLKFCQERYFELSWCYSTAADICMKEVIDICLRRVLWWKIMKTLKALILAIIVLNVVSNDLSFYYTVILQASWYRTGHCQIGKL